MYEDDLWYITDMVDGELKHGYMLITKRHIKTPYDINKEEWIAPRDLLPTIRNDKQAYLSKILCSTERIVAGNPS